MNSGLTRQFLEMAEQDQQLLTELFASGELPSETYHPRMREVHENNAAALKAIIAEHGWPDRAIVGADGS